MGRGTVKRIRASQERAAILPGRRLSLHLMVQPDAAAALLSNAVLRDQGLLSWVLVAAPDSLAGGRLYRDPRPEDMATIEAFGARILLMLEAPLPLEPETRNELTPRVLSMSADTERYWKGAYDNIEAQSGKIGELAIINEFAAKAAEHATRIAGVLTIYENIGAAEITVKAMDRAIALIEWYLAEAMRLAQASRTDARLLHAQSLLDWLRARPEDTFQLRDLLRLGPRPRTKAAAEEAIRILIEHFWIREVSQRPRTFLLRRGT